MDSDEREICGYLKACPGQWVSGREISRRASGKRRFREDPNWTAQPLNRLLERAILESDSTGHYRLKTYEPKKKPQKWISPQIKKILEQTGKSYETGVELDAPEDFYDR